MISRRLKDSIAGKAMEWTAFASCAVAGVIVLSLCIRSWDILSTKPISQLLFSSSWHPMESGFGFLPFIAGTLWVTVLAMLLAVPICIFTSIYISEYAGHKIKELIRSSIDLLAGIPSVVFGVWGVLAVVPFIKNVIAPIFGVETSGYCTLAAGIVLAIMVLPVIISVLSEVMQTVPHELKDASLSLGATKWQTIKNVVLRKSMSGLVAAIILGFSRAFGETMAVLMVAGNVAKIPSSVFDPAYPLPALIANNYGEMMSIPLYDSALMFAALLLLVIVLFFNVLARFVLVRIGAY
jgi:phosphate transport system permease protein